MVRIPIIIASAIALVAAGGRTAADANHGAPTFAAPWAPPGTGSQLDVRTVSANGLAILSAHGIPVRVSR